MVDHLHSQCHDNPQSSWLFSGVPISPELERRRRMEAVPERRYAGGGRERVELFGVGRFQSERRGLMGFDSHNP